MSLGDSQRTRHVVALIAGLMRIEEQNCTTFFGSKTCFEDNTRWDYVGLAYNLNWSGLFFEFGMTTGSGDYGVAEAALQLGYIHRFDP